MPLIGKLKARARACARHIVLPEGEDPRVVAAAASVIREGFAKITLLGRKQIIESVAADLHVPLNGIAITDPSTSPRLNAYTQIYYERRRARGASFEEARETAQRPLYFAALAVAAGDADGTVGGAANTTAETVRAAVHAAHRHCGELLNAHQAWVGLAAMYGYRPEDVTMSKGDPAFPDHLQPT